MTNDGANQYGLDLSQRFHGDAWYWRQRPQTADRRPVTQWLISTFSAVVFAGVAVGMVGLLGG